MHRTGPDYGEAVSYLRGALWEEDEVDGRHRQLGLKNQEARGVCVCFVGFVVIRQPGGRERSVSLRPSLENSHFPTRQVPPIHSVHAHSVLGLGPLESEVLSFTKGRKWGQLTLSR